MTQQHTEHETREQQRVYHKVHPPPPWIQNTSILYPGFNFTTPEFIASSDRMTFVSQHLEMMFSEPAKLGKVSLFPFKGTIEAPINM